MEAFTKYRIKSVKDLGLVPSKPYDAGYLIGIQHGWRAALEWAQEQGSVNNYTEIADELEDK